MASSNEESSREVNRKGSYSGDTRYDGSTTYGSSGHESPKTVGKVENNARQMWFNDLRRWLGVSLFALLFSAVVTGIGIFRYYEPIKYVPLGVDGNSKLFLQTSENGKVIVLVEIEEKQNLLKLYISQDNGAHFNQVLPSLKTVHRSNYDEFYVKDVFVEDSLKAVVVLFSGGREKDRLPRTYIRYVYNFSNYIWYSYSQENQKYSGEKAVDYYNNDTIYTFKHVALKNINRKGLASTELKLTASYKNINNINQPFKELKAFALKDTVGYLPTFAKSNESDSIAIVFYKDEKIVAYIGPNLSNLTYFGGNNYPSMSIRKPHLSFGANGLRWYYLIKDSLEDNGIAMYGADFGGNHRKIASSINHKEIDSSSYISYANGDTVSMYDLKNPDTLYTFFGNEVIKAPMPGIYSPIFLNSQNYFALASPNLLFRTINGKAETFPIHYTWQKPWVPAWYYYAALGLVAASLTAAVILVVVIYQVRRKTLKEQEEMRPPDMLQLLNDQPMVYNNGNY